MVLCVVRGLFRTIRMNDDLYVKQLETQNESLMVMLESLNKRIECLEEQVEHERHI